MLQIADAPNRYAASAPASAALLVQGNEVTWAELRDRVERATAQLREAEGVRRILRLDHSLTHIAALLASARCTGETLLLPAHYPIGDEYAWLDRFGAAVLFDVDSRGLRVAARREGAQEVSPEAAEPSVGVLTSGTTGRPKVVRHTWRSLVAAIEIQPRFREKRWLLVYPLAHFGGLQVLAQSILNCATLVVPEDFRPVHAARAIRDHGVNYLSCSPTFMRQLFMLAEIEDWGATAVEHIAFGGEIVDQAILDLVQARIPGARTSQVYASAEFGVAAVVRDGRAGFDARLLDSGRMKIVDGELHVRPARRGMLGYLGQADREGDWMPTGDLVCVEGDRVHFLGRKDDVINVGSFKVHPAIVEQVIRDVASVQEVAVTGQANPVTGNLVKAVARLRARFASTSCANAGLACRTTWCRRFSSSATSSLSPGLTSSVADDPNPDEPRAGQDRTSATRSIDRKLLERSRHILAWRPHNVRRTKP